MDLTLHSGDTHQIQSYDDSFIKINKQEYKSSLIVSADTLIHPWELKDVRALTIDLVQPIIDLSPQVCILGTGRTLTFPPPSVIQHFALHKLTPEVMTTASACRTFNVLLSEGRNVVAGLIL